MPLWLPNILVFHVLNQNFPKRYESLMPLRWLTSLNTVSWLTILLQIHPRVAKAELFCLAFYQYFQILICGSGLRAGWFILSLFFQDGNTEATENLVTTVRSLVMEVEYQPSLEVYCNNFGEVNIFFASCLLRPSLRRHSRCPPLCLGHACTQYPLHGIG